MNQNKDMLQWRWCPRISSGVRVIPPKEITGPGISRMVVQEEDTVQFTYRLRKGHLFAEDL